MRRSAKDWVLLAVFYIVLYACLAGFFAIMMLGLLATIRDDRPKYILEESIIGTSPGISFRPLSDDVESSLIWIKQNDSSYGWQKWSGKLKTFLRPYLKNDTHENDPSLAGCDLGYSANDSKQFCPFNPFKALGKTCSENNNFGYSKKQPCFVFKLNKIFGWKPDTYKSIQELPKEYRELRGNDFKPNHIGVTCSGAFAADVENLGDVAYYPEYGFPTQYFPFLSQKDYLPPLVMVQFLNITQEIMVNIECKLWAKNIIHDRHNRIGYIRFEIMIDSWEEDSL